MIVMAVKIFPISLLGVVLYKNKCVLYCCLATAHLIDYDSLNHYSLIINLYTGPSECDHVRNSKNNFCIHSNTCKYINPKLKIN